MSQASPLAMRYRRALAAFLHEGEPEAALLDSYDCGRQAIAEGWSLLDLATLYRQSLLEIGLNGNSDMEVRRLITAGEDFLAQSLVPFELARRGFAEANAALKHQALHDQLTGLPNRALFHDQLEQSLATASRLAVLVLGVDRFKDINDTFGHHYGDRLLRDIGARLRNVLHKSHTIARLGGDEFAIFVLLDGSLSAELAGQRLVATLNEPFILDGYELEVGASIGIALVPEHGTDADTLVRRADVAMYAAKRAQTGYATYTSEQDHGSRERLTLIGELRRAIEHNELTLAFQPKVAFDGQVAGVEALARWTHPDRGCILPTQFVPLAEQTGLVKPLTRWVLDAALRQCSAWLEAGHEIPVAVNLAVQDLHDLNLPETIASLLAARRVPVRCLRLEITEGAMMADTARTMDVLERLRAMGVGVSVDDFGTGYSSLAYLKRLPVDELKIDRSFVRQMAEDHDDAAIVNSTIALAHALRMKVVAEGVEDRTTWELLDQFGCDLVQGYFVSRPVPAEELARWLSRRPRGVSDLEPASAPRAAGGTSQLSRDLLPNP